MPARLQERFKLPQIVTGHRSDLWRSFWLVVPAARTNLCRNPSFETGTTNWAALGTAVIAQSTTADTAYVGNASLGVQFPASGDGARYGGTTALSLTSGTAYGASCWIKAATTQIGIRARICIANTSDTVLAASTPIVLDGTWQRLVMVYSETSTTSRRLIVQRNDSLGSKSGTTYVDAVQVEAISDLTQGVSTYLDGDQLGLVPNQNPPPYGWNGTPHNSTSYRLGTTRAGGYQVRLDRLGFTLLTLVGLGAVPPSLVSTPHGQLDGGEYQRTQRNERQFRLVGRFDSKTGDQLDRLRAQFYSFVDRDLIAPDQPLTWLFQKTDPDTGLLKSDLYRIVANYSGGLDGSFESEWAEQAAPEFTQYIPTIASDRENQAPLTVQSTVANADHLAIRSPAGVWSTVTGANSDVYTFGRGLDGTVYIGGNFTNWGDANGDGIVAYNPQTGTISSLTTGVVGAVWSIATLPNGNIVVGGTFTSAGGVANTSRIAVWNPTTAAWSALGTGANDTVYAVTIASNGDIVIGGAFTLAGGVANTVRLARWTGAAWTALSSGATGGDVLALKFGLDGSLFITGNFTTLGGTAGFNGIGKWTTAGAFVKLSTGLNSSGAPGTGGQCLALGPNGKIYVGGFFTLAGGTTGTNRIAIWNGSGFEALNTGLNGDVFSITPLPNTSSFIITGIFTGDGGAAFNFLDSAMLWSSGGGRFLPVVDLPGALGSVQVIASMMTPDGTLYLGGQGTGTLTAEGVATITYSGNSKSWPVLTIKGPSSGTSALYFLKNYTTGRDLYFDYTINSGETVVLSLEPNNIRMTSDFAGDITAKIITGAADWYLQKGSNTVSFFAASSSVSAFLRWRTRYDSVVQTTR